ncbi:MAG TPA: DNA methyltransferase, partial [Gemmatimonadaceae bacterium]|nr:DNA methyltransferase [Gemmatimonadaceae bacterium]
MLTLRAAAQLLTATDSLDALAPIAAAIGFDAEPSPLDADTRTALGLAAPVLEARVSAGPGALRALHLIVESDAALPALLPKLAARLASRAPHALWLVLAVQPATGRVALAAWSGERRTPRVAALVVDRARVVDSDAETLRGLAAAAGESDLVVHARLVEILGREALTARFYRALEQAVSRIARSCTAGSDDQRSELALLAASRLLFLAFLEAKGWLNGDRAFLLRQFEQCVASGGRFERRVLRPLFFGTLNTPAAKRAAAARTFGRIPFLNGGLFARTPLERASRAVSFADDAYGALLYDVFAQYRFTAREESVEWSEAAVDPEMLGRAFESLMASAERRRTGAFFTPFELVARVADAGLESALGEFAGTLLRGDTISADARALLQRAIEQLTVLDPACGSGAFLVHSLERLAALRVQLGDRRDLAAVRRDVLTRSIFGVDVNPTAVWLCELRLWLSVVIESTESDPAAVVPLPNLDRNIRVGDALAGGAFSERDVHARAPATLRHLRERYSRATGIRKLSLARTLERAERARAIAMLDGELELVRQRRRDLVVARRGRDLFGARRGDSAIERRTSNQLRRSAAELRTLRRRIAAGGALPFTFSVHFADVASRGGFDLVVGNPPWVRVHRVAATQREIYRRDFRVARASAWDAGAVLAGATRGFAAQVDVAALFVERSLQLLAPGGSLAMLVPSKLWCSLAGGGVRRLLSTDANLRRIEDYSAALAVFDAAAYPSLVVAERTPIGATPTRDVRVAVARANRDTYGWCQRSPLAFDASPGAPWILLPPDPRRAFDRLLHAGQSLAESPVGRPRLGVKCGCNDAFVVQPPALDDASSDVVEVCAADGARARLERALLRPLLRGELLERWRVPQSPDAILWTHDARGAPLAQLPPHAARWLARWRRTLVARADSRSAARWWMLFRTEAARSDKPRVVWCDMGREPRAAVLEAGDPRVPLNSCYVARCSDLVDADTLATLLNSAVARAWLNAIAEPARGGYRRYFGWTMSL